MEPLKTVIIMITAVKRELEDEQQLVNDIRDMMQDHDNINVEIYAKRNF